MSQKKVGVQEIEMRRNIWLSTDEESSEESDQPQNSDSKILCLKWDLETIEKKGFLKPKLAIYLMFACCVSQLALIMFVFGYSTNWDKLVLVPITLSQYSLQVIFLHEVNEPQQKSIVMKISIIALKVFFGSTSTFSVVYAMLFNTPFNNATLYMTMVFGIVVITCFIICLCGNYDDLPHTFFKESSNNANNNNNQIRPQVLHVQNKHKQYIMKLKQKSKFKINQDEFDEWGVLKQKIWTAIVTSVMYTDVVSDVYYGYFVFSTYGAQSKFLFFSGIMLMLCCVADLFYVFFMLIFPGWVSHFAHTVAFIMEMPNFVLTGISVWKLRQLIDQELVEDDQGQNLAIFSIISTCVNALIHIMYIVDSWAVKNAVEFIQTL